MKNILFMVILIFVTFQSNAQNQKVTKKDLRRLAEIMNGSFSSQEQSKADSSYFHISLKMTPVWKKEKDGYWLYVEQAMATALDKPYRQRVYHLYLQDDTTLVSKVFELQNPKDVINGWQDKSKLDGIIKDNLVDRQGCSIYLHKTKEGYFKGSTPGKECLSTLRGATYATSEVIIQKDRMISWDRGWDIADKQVWGAVKGGYIFVRESQK
jgi:hypothetical protein